MIREASGVEPRAFVRWGAYLSPRHRLARDSGGRLRSELMSRVERGVESQTGLSGLNEKDVEGALRRLVNQQTVG